MNKRMVSLGVVMAMNLSLVGCGSSSDIAKLNSLQALNSESTVNSYSLTTSEKEEAVYAQVVARQLLDFTTLDPCSDNEKQQVLQYMNNVDSQLTGMLSAKDGVIDESYTNYLLMEFEKTPYYWQRAQTVIRGIDAESRSIVVDVTYKTINFKKDVQGASYLVQGEPNYEQKMQVRYNRWLSILDSKYKTGNVSWQSQYQKFKSVYGDPNEIFNSQRNLTLTENVYETGNQKTYSGLVDTAEEDSHATMVVRYVLTPSYVLGINTGVVCDHMYRVSYSLDNDFTSNLELFKDEGYATIADNIYDLLYSYFTCIDESDYSGLYSLSKKFKDQDKYYTDYFETTYRKHEGFTVSLFDISGTKVKCGVSISSKIRAKGSNMTSPIYKDRYYVELELVDDSLQVTNMVLLSSALEGEPAISTSDAEVSGFVSSIDLDNQDKKDIEGLIANFGAIQLLKDTSSDDFGDIIDISMSQNQLTEIKENMTSVSGEKKVVWLMNYMQGTSNYASVKCRELYQQKDNSITEVNVTYNFINKGNKWYIYSYDINSSVKLDTTNLTTTGSLCVVTSGKVDTLTSQVVNTTGSQSGNSLENIGTTYEHDSYIPILRNGTTEKGLVKLTPDTITDKQLTKLFNELVSNYDATTKITSYSDVEGVSNSIKALVPNSDKAINLDGCVKDLVCMYYNYVNNRFINLKEFSTAQSNLASTIEESQSALKSSMKDLTNDGSADMTNLEGLEECFTAWRGWVDSIKFGN